MNRLEIRLDNNELAAFPCVCKQNKTDFVSNSIWFAYAIISTPWFLHNFFALFSINEMIWCAGETWSIDLELSVPRNLVFKTDFGSINRRTCRARLSNELLHTSFGRFSCQFQAHYIRRRRRASYTWKNQTMIHRELLPVLL